VTDFVATIRVRPKAEVRDPQGEAVAGALRSLGMDVVALPTIMRSIDDRVALAQEVLDFAAAIRTRLEAEVQ